MATTSMQSCTKSFDHGITKSVMATRYASSRRAGTRGKASNGIFALEVRSIASLAMVILPVYMNLCWPLSLCLLSTMQVAVQVSGCLRPGHQ